MTVWGHYGMIVPSRHAGHRSGIWVFPPQKERKNEIPYKIPEFDHIRTGYYGMTVREHSRCDTMRALTG
jgi:hypothetical protein